MISMNLARSSDALLAEREASRSLPKVSTRAEQKHLSDREQPPVFYLNIPARLMMDVQQLRCLNNTLSSTPNLYLERLYLPSFDPWRQE
jgi:hypothetical protein